LYNGLPVRFGLRIPAALTPTVSAEILDADPDTPGNAFSGGPVYDATDVELDAASRDWIWLRMEEKEENERWTRCP
ncbi:MAG: hypothetical protein ACK57G_02575, partial [Planctomycetota bacterium]